MQCFDYSLENGIAHLRMNRPQAMNTMHPVFFRELQETLARLKKGNEARVLVISSTGKHFTAGMALDVFGTGVSFNEQSAAGRIRIREELADFMSILSLLEEVRIPVIAAIQGGCIGGGVDLVSACDIRYCTDDAFFCIQEINIGMVADLGTLQRLPKLIPLGIVKELAYSGRRLPAARALACGLANETFTSQEAMLEAAMKLAAEIAAKPPVAVYGSKLAINYARDHSVAESLEQMTYLQAGWWQTSNLTESFVANKEKRAGRFDDLQPTVSITEHDYALK
jgi:enoyl-CoA hydratase